MRAIDVLEPGEPQSMTLATVPDPVPAPDEVVVRVAAAGVNRADILQRRGHYPPPPGASPILGLECSGTIEALGREVTGWSVGDRVAALLDGGGYAERVAVPAAQLLAVPEGLDLVDAGSLPEALCTAHSNLVGVGGLRAGHRVLIHGGSGGVGSAAIQLAKLLGAWVVTTAGGPERVAGCLALGADAAIDHRAEDVTARIRELTAGAGVDVILDVLGAGGLPGNVRSLATGGRLVVIGMQQGRVGQLDLGHLLTRRASVHGTTLRARPASEKARIVAEVATEVWAQVGAGPDAAIRPIVAERIALAEAARAHELLDSGAVFGKLVLIP